MYTIKLNNAIKTPENYKHGQTAEYIARYTLTGKACKADNVKFTESADCNDIQIKSARATICTGTDIKAHIAIDAAKKYGYVIKDFSVMYIMTPTEYLEFTETFKTVTTDSVKNGGAVKTRLKSESKALIQYLMERV